MKSLKKRKTEMNLIESNIQNDFVYIEVKDWGSRLKQTGWHETETVANCTKIKKLKVWDLIYQYKKLYLFKKNQKFVVWIDTNIIKTFLWSESVNLLKSNKK